jgi:hydroxyacylglutathione hydrolase
MYHSLSALGKLPGETLVYCGHEYTENNLNFAISVESDNAAVANRLEEVKTMRVQGRPTVPATIAVELESNPFMRADDKNLASLMGKESPVDVFAELRSRKDSF